MKSHHVREHVRRNGPVSDYWRGRGVGSTVGKIYHGSSQLFKGGSSTELTSSQRNALPDSAFAVPSERAYPVPTADQLRAVGAKRPEASSERHARNALARVAQHGSEYEKRQVCELVSKRHPEIHALNCRLH